MLDTAGPDRRQSVLADRRASPRVSVDTGEIQERRRRGRPSVDPTGRSERISTRVSQETFDALCRRASQRGKELAEHVRELLDRDAAIESSVAKTRLSDQSVPL